MKDFFKIAKTYILLASIYPEGTSKPKTIYNLNYKIYPAYIEIEYSNKSILIHYEKSVIHISYTNLEKVELSICGRRASIRQSYLFTLNIQCKDGLSLEIETFDYAEAIRFYKIIESKNIKSNDKIDVIGLMKTHKTTQDLYDYINKNSESLFKDAPKNKKRISYLVADI